MAAHRIAAIASRCRSCSVSPSIFTSFTPVPHIPTRTAALAAVARRQNFHHSAIVRTTEKSESDAAHNEATSTPAEGEEELIDEDITEPEAIEGQSGEFVGERDPEPLADNSKPWYLQVEPPKITRSPLLERHPIPELPEESPEELAPLLKQLDEEEGINAMKILDLRHLDRPTAIGANTIMVVGTARSIRHLHGTADRICRWLRSQYKWRPHADGLLGRNELKLINRRKRRRGKVVSGEMGVLDEADSAGWVCVNTGEKGIVLQLFTEAKREEIDLEGLWTDVLEKDRQRKERIAKKLDEDASLIRRVNSGPRLDEEPLRHNISSVSGPFTQTRSFHSGRRKFSGAEKTAAKSAEGSPRSSVKRPLVIDRAKTHIRKLKSVPDPENHLGNGPEDRTSTPFLQSFYLALEELPRAAKIQYQLQLLTIGTFIKPEAYPQHCAQQFLRDLKAQGVTIRIDYYYYILLQVALLPRAFSNSSSRIHGIHSILLDMHEDFEIAEMEAFEKSPEVRYACWLAYAPAGLLSLRRQIMRCQFIDNDVEWVSPLENENAKKAIAQFGPLDADMRQYDPIPDATAVKYGIIEHQLDALCANAWCNNWKRFWEIWDNIQLAMIPRNQEYYQVALGAILLGRNQLAALRAVRLFPDSMANENPSVGIGGDVAGYMLGVLEVAKNGRKMPEFDKLERHCMQRRRREALLPNSGNAA